MRFSWSVSCFSFQFSLVLFAEINGWTPTNFFWRSCLAFHLPRTLRFHSIRFHECSLFLELRLAFDFRLDLCSDLVISFYQGIFFFSGPYWFSSKELVSGTELRSARVGAMLGRPVNAAERGFFFFFA
jgi:hypothetical protein